MVHFYYFIIIQKNISFFFRIMLSEKGIGE